MRDARFNDDRRTNAMDDLVQCAQVVGELDDRAAAEAHRVGLAGNLSLPEKLHSVPSARKAEVLPIVATALSN